MDPATASRVVVSTRDPNNNLRSTVPNATSGKFVLAYLPENTNYTVVMEGRDLTTAAVTGVPVSIAVGTTTLNTPTTFIPMLASSSATVSGSVKNTSNAQLSDAAVNAQQVLSTGQNLDVSWSLVDPTNANYSLSLPLGVNRPGF